MAKRNTGSFTYDGIERGGERVCAEIEETMREGNFTKLSIVGYSLGGLVARYAVGLLQAKGILDQVECLNFITFATPHLGVPTPMKGWHSNVWNALGARTLSESGRQLFVVDSFRDDGRPLLAVMTDPKSIFMTGLRKFKRPTLYCNIVNDRSVVYYSAAISKTDPYTDPDTLNVNFLDGFEDVILDPKLPFDAKPKVQQPSTSTDTLVKWTKRVPMILTLTFLIPIGIVGFLCNSAYQTARSASRIKLHEKGEGGIDVDRYRVPLLIKEMRGEVEQVFETLNAAQGQQYLRAEDESSGGEETDQRRIIKRERRMSVPTQPTLALKPSQFEMIDSLNSIGWRKFPVWIHKVRHSHAAIIVRMDREAFSEGRVVMRHFAETEFLL